MADEFKPGDVGIYVGPGKAARPSHPLVHGRAYRVRDVLRRDCFGRAGLVIDGPVFRHPTGAWAASRFRKLPPASADFTRDMRALRPQREEA